MWNLPAIIDDFNRADENPISSRNWWAANGHGGFQLIGSTLCANNWNALVCWDGTMNGATSVGTYNSSQDICVGYKVTSIIGDTPYYWEFGAMFRPSTNPDGFWNAKMYRAIVGRSGGGSNWYCTFQRYDQAIATAYERPEDKILFGSVAIGDTITFISKADGTQIAFLNGTEQCRYIDNTSGWIDNNGCVGVYAGFTNNPTNRWEGFDDVYIGTVSESPDYVPYFRVNLAVGTTPASGGRYLYVRHRASGTYTTNYVYGMYSAGTLAQEATFLSVGSLWTIGTITIGSTIPNYGSLAVQTRVYVS